MKDPPNTKQMCADIYALLIFLFMLCFYQAYNQKQ